LGIGVFVIVSRRSSNTAALARSVALYQARLNAMCRATRPKLVAAQEAMSRAADHGEWEIAFRKDVKLGLAENSMIVAAPVPSPLKGTMNQAIIGLKRLDTTMSRAERSLLAGNEPQALLGRASSLETQSDRYLDAAGLRDCVFGG
jgi:hypothetical protein